MGRHRGKGDGENAISSFISSRQECGARFHQISNPNNQTQTKLCVCRSWTHREVSSGSVWWSTEMWEKGMGYWGVEGWVGMAVTCSLGSETLRRQAQSSPQKTRPGGGILGCHSQKQVEKPHNFQNNSNIKAALITYIKQKCQVSNLWTLGLWTYRYPEVERHFWKCILFLPVHINSYCLEISNVRLAFTVTNHTNLPHNGAQKCQSSHQLHFISKNVSNGNVIICPNIKKNSHQKLLTTFVFGWAVRSLKYFLFSLCMFRRWEKGY